MLSTTLRVDSIADTLLQLYGREEVKKVLSPISVLDWAKTYRRIGGQPFSLDEYPCLEKIYEDKHPFKVIQKPAQVGVSEYLINLAVHAMDCGVSYYNLKKARLNVGYIFPTHSSLAEFAKERLLAGIFEESDYLGGIVRARETGKSKMSIRSSSVFYRIKESFFHLRGAWNPSVSLKSFPVDLLIIDELDECPDRAVALAEKRLRASDLRYRVYVSTPTYPGRGISYYYSLSDQHIWEIRCPNCGLWQEPDFFNNVFLREDDQFHPYSVWKSIAANNITDKEFVFACRACFFRLNKLAKGRWRAQNPGSYIRGYRIPGLVSPKVPLIELVRNSLLMRPAEIQEFWNSDLGLPFAPSGGSLNESVLSSCELKGIREFKDPNHVEYSVAGVDVGAKLHLTIESPRDDGRWETVYMAELDDFEELDLLFHQFKIRSLVVDAYPETREAKRLAERFRGLVWLGRYPNMTSLETAVFRDDNDERVPLVDIARTQAMDEVTVDIIQQKSCWPEGTRYQFADFYSQLCAPVKTKVESTRSDGSVIEKYSYVESGPDHWFHSRVYSYIARKRVAGWTPTEDADSLVGKDEVSIFGVEF